VLSVLSEVVPLALAGAISPLVLLAALVLLGSPSHPLLRCGMFTLGILAMTAIFFGGGYMLLGLDLQGAKGHHGLLSSQPAQIAMAVFLYAGAVWFCVKAPSEATQQKWLDRVNSPRIPAVAYLAVGLVMMWFSASFVVMLAILHRLSVAALPLGDNVTVLVIATVITALPALVPFLAALVGGNRRRAEFQRLGAWTFRNGRFILAALFVVLGTQNLLHAL
jgi:Sap, sulfolipid-1-addressing protein